jgi:hypothetical protein
MKSVRGSTLRVAKEPNFGSYWSNIKSGLHESEIELIRLYFVMYVERKNLTFV